MPTTQKFEIKDGDGWITAKKAAPVKRGWLHYELRDWTIGLAMPGTWRVKNDDPAAVSLGKKGGLMTSEAKAAAARLNGKKGGRPRGTQQKPRTGEAR